MSSDYRFYISAAAVREYMRICGLPDATDGPAFQRAEQELAALCDDARLAKDVGPGQDCQQWRVKSTVRGKRTRLELLVSLSERSEGDLPQLIFVRNKGP